MKKLAALFTAIFLVCALGSALAEAIPVTLKDGGIQCDNAAVSVEGNKVTILAPGEYEFTGALSDGQIIVSSDDEGDVTLILSGVAIHSERSAAIYVKQCASNVIISLSSASQNELSGGANYDVDGDDEPNAVLFSHDDLLIEGNGKLKVSAPFMDGIVSKDDLLIKSGDITIDAARNGIRGRDSVEILGGSITITAGNDGIKSTNDKDFSKGYVTISGGAITITCTDDPISVETKLSILGGVINASLTEE